MNPAPHFRLLGVPVRVEPLFWVITVFLGFNLQEVPLIVTWVGVVFVSVLVHELGHALALKSFGQASSIVLHGFGGLTFSQRRLGRVQSIVVSLAGPGAAIALLGVPAYLLRDGSFGADAALRWFQDGGGFGLWPVLVFATYVNIWWSFANLLPIRPLDGGNVLTEIVGLQPARLVSAVVATGAAVWAYTHAGDFQYAAFFAAMLAFLNFNEYRRARTGSDGPSTFDVEAPPTAAGVGQRPGQAPGRSNRLRLVDGASEAPRPSARPAEPPMAMGLIDAAQAEPIIWQRLAGGDVAAARAVADRTRGLSPFVAGVVALASGEGVGPLVDAYLSDPSGPTALAVTAAVDDAGAVGPLVDALVAAGPAGAAAAHGIQSHLHYGRRFASSAMAGERLHGSTANRAQVAFDVACSLAASARPDEALSWLSRAIDDGFHAGRLLDGEPDLAPVRALPGWSALRARID